MPDVGGQKKVKAPDVIEVLAEQFLKKGLPGHIRSDNGPEFTARAVRQWLEKFNVQNLFIEPGTPGKMGTTNHSMGNSGTSCSMEKSLPA